MSKTLKGPSDDVHSSLPTSFRTLPAIALIACLGAIILIIPIAQRTGHEFGFFTRDPTQVGQIPFFAGYLSNLGVMSWTTGATIALFSSTVLARMDSEGRNGHFLCYFGCLTAFLAFDDLFLLHENFYWNEKLLFLFYGTIALFGTFRYRERFLHHGQTFAVIAAFAFVLSLTIDRLQYELQDQIGDLRILIEDGAKFFGSVSWAIFLVKASARSILESSKP